jgi:hypothetical protein
MPRKARIKPNDVGTFYHCMNRIVGEEGEYPFGDMEKNKFIQLIKEAARYFTVEVLSYQVMGNHWHIVCYAPAELLSPTEAAERFNEFYAGKKPVLKPEDPECERVAAYMRDISNFIGWIQQCFTTWFNNTRVRRRRGTLWVGRFTSTILERDSALWECLFYVEMNAVRAGIAQAPADYRFGSWGEWCSTGKHPFGDNLLRRLPEYEGSQARDTDTLKNVRKRFRVDLARRSAADAGASPEEIEDAMAKAARNPGFVVRIDRRVRYWGAGVIIGSKQFVVDMAARRDGPERAEKRSLQRAKQNGQDVDLWSYRRLRNVAS